MQCSCTYGMPRHVQLLEFRKRLIHKSYKQIRSMKICFPQSSTMLAKNVRDQGLISRWDTEFFGSLIVTNSTYCYIWWSVWSLYSKCMRKYFLRGRGNILCLNRESTLVSSILGDTKLSFLYWFIVKGNLISAKSLPPVGLNLLH